MTEPAKGPVLPVPCVFGDRGDKPGLFGGLEQTERDVRSMICQRVSPLFAALEDVNPVRLTRISMRNQALSVQVGLAREQPEHAQR